MSFLLPTTWGRKSANPKGILQQSPGLARSAYPGTTIRECITPKGLWPDPVTIRHTPVGVKAHVTLYSQGSSFLRLRRASARRVATLGIPCISILNTNGDFG